MSNDLDFEGLAQDLLSRARDILPVWLPGGRLIGHEYTCGDLRGSPGDSLKCNVNTGKWADFAGTERGGDLISLYAAIEGIGQGDAARRLAEDTGFQLRETKPYNPETKPAEPVTEVVETETLMPPEDAPQPSMEHPKYGYPTMSWVYLDAHSRPMFYISRYEGEDGKQIVPWSWVGGRWQMKGWPAPRPLFGLDELANRPEALVLVVEGEKAAVAARQIAGRTYAVVTWPNGAKAIQKADWTPLHGRKLLLWPDADGHGVKAMREIAGLLSPHCEQIRMLDPDGQPDGWDAADALDQGWNWAEFKEWAKPRASNYVAEVEAVAEAAVMVESADEGVKVAAAVSAQATAIVNTDSDNLQETSTAMFEKLGIVCTKMGQPICNVDNVLRVFETMPEMKGLVWYDEFHHRYFTRWRSESIREWADIDDLQVTAMLQRKIGILRISDDIVHKAVMLYAEEDKRNAPRDWMAGLVWDGVPRIDMFLTECFGVEDSDYTRRASKNWWVGIAARVFRPGCKLDNMLILESCQGKLKSTALNILGGEWYAESNESVSSKDFFITLEGKLIIEISELDSFSKADSNMVKKVITCQTDRYRPPYGRVAKDFPRRCIFVGSTNEKAYLRDSTGARRFWPVKIGDIDIEKVRANREQLYAEAVVRFNEGDTWWEMPIEQTLEHQEMRREVDEWESIINNYLKGKSEVTIAEIGMEALKIDIGRFDINAQRRVGKILRLLKWEKMHHNRDGTRGYTWREPNFYKTTDDPPY